MTDSFAAPKVSLESSPARACEVMFFQFPSEPRATFQNQTTGHDEALSPVQAWACVTW